MAQKKPKQQATEKAARLLARRMYGTQEMRDKLYRYGYEKDEIDETMDFLQEQGYVDDLAFGAAYVRDKATFLRKGPKLIEMELGKKKVRKRDHRTSPG